MGWNDGGGDGSSDTDPPEISSVRELVMGMNDADFAILAILTGGRNVAANLEHVIPWKRAYITQRLVCLEEQGIVVNCGHGLYEINTSGFIHYFKGCPHPEEEDDPPSENT